MRRIVMLLLVPCLVISAVAATNRRSVRLTNPFVNFAQDIGCGYCTICSGDGHRFTVDAENKPLDGFDHQACYPNECGTGAHPPCGGSDDSETATASKYDPKLELALETAAVLARKGDVEAVRELIKLHRDRAVFNAKRGALQIAAPCARQVIIAHVPLTPAQLQVARESSADRQ